MKLVIAIVIGSVSLSAQNPDRKKQLEYTRAHYTKYDYRIPMRDGVKLFTSVYVPKDRPRVIHF